MNGTGPAYEEILGNGGSICLQAEQAHLEVLNASQGYDVPDMVREMGDVG